MTTTELSLSSAAAQRLQALGQSEGKPIMLRIAVEGGGCSGFQYQLDLVDEAQPDDLRIERDGVAALIDEMSLVMLKGSEIDYVDELAGAEFKIRNPNVPSFNVMAEAVGAIPTPIDFAELYVALQRGVVQGQHNPVGNIVGARLYEVQDSLSMVPWGISPHMVSVSTGAWDKLDPAQQEAVTRAASETAAEDPAIAVEEEAKLLAEIEDKIKIIRPEGYRSGRFPCCLPRYRPACAEGRIW